MDSCSRAHRAAGGRLRGGGRAGDPWFKPATRIGSWAGPSVRRWLADTSSAGRLGRARCRLSPGQHLTPGLDAEPHTPLLGPTRTDPLWAPWCRIDTSGPDLHPECQPSTPPRPPKSRTHYPSPSGGQRSVFPLEQGSPVHGLLRTGRTAGSERQGSE